MERLTGKLQYKENFRCLVLNKPGDVEDLSFPYDRSRIAETYDLEITFVSTVDELQTAFSAMKEGDDRIRWLAYPKKSSGVTTDLTRDIITDLSGHTKFRPVAMISLNDTWSAMRLRPESKISGRIREASASPDVMEPVFTSCKECRDFFNQLSNTNKKEYILWIANAKREETRNRRIEKAKMLLRDKIPNPYAGR